MTELIPQDLFDYFPELNYWEAGNNPNPIPVEVTNKVSEWIFEADSTLSLICDEVNRDLTILYYCASLFFITYSKEDLKFDFSTIGSKKDVSSYSLGENSISYTGAGSISSDSNSYSNGFIDMFNDNYYGKTFLNRVKLLTSLITSSCGNDCPEGEGVCSCQDT